MKREKILKWLQDREYALETYHNTACSTADIARHLQCSPTKVDGMISGRVPKAVAKYLGLLNQGGTFQLVAVPVTVPTGDFCCDGQMRCEHLQVRGGEPYCLLTGFIYEPTAFVLQTDTDGHIRKPLRCRTFMKL